MRVLVTGAGGNIGTSTLAALTAQGHRVRALVTDTARGNVARRPGLIPRSRSCEATFATRPRCPAS